MKTHILSRPVLLVLCALLTDAGAAEAPAMRDVVSGEQLLAARRKAQQTDPMKRMTVSRVVDPIANRPKDLIAESDILCFQGLATLVPKRAILQVPSIYRQRLGIQPGARIVSWGEFYAANRGWITTVDVDLAQAKGNLPMSGPVQKLMTTCSNLVVATCMGGPITVLPLKNTGPPVSPEP